MQTHKLKLDKRGQALITIGVFLVALGVFIIYSQRAFGVLTKEAPVSQSTFGHFNFFASSTAQSITGNFATTTATTTGNVFTNLQVNTNWGATSTNMVAYFDSNGTRDNGAYVIAGAKKVTMYFKRGDTSGRGNTGTTTFRVQVSPNGTNWYPFNKLISSASVTTADTAQTRVGSVTASDSLTADARGTSTQVYSLDLENDTFFAIRCIITATSTTGGGNILPDGEHSCSASVDY